jgi:biotin operon repressor
MSTASEHTARAIDELKNNAARLLALLSDGRWHSQQELAEVAGYRCGGRVHDLRRQGHRIEKVALKAREYHYRLLPREDLFA